MAKGNPNLAQKCIWSKYIKNNLVIQFSKGSHIWKGIGKGDVSIWFDNWLGCGTLRSLVYGPLNKDEENLNVINLIQNASWCLNNLSISLPHPIRERIFDLEPPVANSADQPCSVFVNEKGFDVSKAYEAQLPNPPSYQNPSWIWTLSYQPKIQCNFAREVWTQTPAPPITDFPNLFEWFAHNVGIKTLFRGLIWGDLFPILYHEIWKARNKTIFDFDNRPSSHSVFTNALRLTYELHSMKSIHANSIPHHNNMSTTPTIPDNWSTLHTDASFVSTMTMAGLAGVIRNKNGMWVMGFQRHYYANNPLMAELRAIYEGIKITKSLEITHIMIFTDCRAQFLYFQTPLLILVCTLVLSTHVGNSARACMG
ncbi:hypothetical protein RDABS01_033448 [Bienertia sinuspersici]